MERETHWADAKRNGASGTACAPPRSRTDRDNDGVVDDRDRSED